MKFVDWVVTGYDRSAAVALNRHGINPLVSVFLSSRGIVTTRAAEHFLSRDPGALGDPYLLRDMHAAVARIRRAMAAGERIAIYGDYDVDGMTASCLLAGYFRSKGTPCEIYIPNRTDEGYGVNTAALDALAARGVSLVVTVDCGVTARQEALYARGLGLDLVITDHHECKDELPDAVAVVNPKRPDCPYPDKTLAGVGVAFKLLCALEYATPPEKLLEAFGDFVAIGTIADVMPVTGENRILIRHGLDALNTISRPGLRSLMEETCFDRGDINTASIGFVLAPRLNAAGRMGRVSLAVDLLLTDDDGEAGQLTAELCRLNSERREIESAIFEQARAHLDAHPPKGPIVLSGKDWYQGVMGIVAARISERFFFPAIMISVGEDGVARGSCRSFGSFPMYSALKHCSDLLKSYGGHEMAAGLTMEEADIPAFRQRIFAFYHNTIKIPDVPTLRLDFEVIKPELLTLENVAALKQAEPFGNGNRPPFLLLRAAQLQSLTAVGGGRHAKLRVVKAGRSFDCICFNRPPDELGLREASAVDLAFEPVVNEYRGWRNVQLHVIDVRPHVETANG